MEITYIHVNGQLIVAVVFAEAGFYILHFN